MKKKFLVCGMLVIVAITALNINMSGNRNRFFNMTLKSLEGHAYDLPEADIICSTHQLGPCWKWVYYLGGGGVVAYCEFSGRMDDYCVMP